MKRSEIYFSVALIPLDFLTLLGSFVVAYYLRDTSFLSAGQIGEISSRIQYNPTLSILPLDQYLHYVWYILPAMIIIFAVNGLYAIRSRTPFWQRFVQIIFGVSSGEFFILLLFLLKGNFFIPRSTVLYSWIIGIVAVTLVRQLIIVFQRFLRRYNVGVVQLAIIGGSEVVKELITALCSQSAYAIAYQSDAQDIPAILTALDPIYLDEVMVVNELFSVDDLIQIRNYCLERHISFSFVPSLLTILTESALSVRTEAGVPTIEIRPTPLEGWGRVFKRVFDVVISTLFLVVFSWLYLIIYIVMKLTSPGPVIFRHARIGRGSKIIYVSKYRSMKVGWSDEDGKLPKPFQEYLDSHPEAAQEWQNTMKLRNDPRISKIGKFLRKTRLDELPQFVDVLQGSLSLVGPRPIIESEIERFGDKARILFTVRPGITGLWQVEGGNELSYNERVVLNSYYIEHWSPWLDIGILLRTAGIVISDVFRKIFGSDQEGSTY